MIKKIFIEWNCFFLVRRRGVWILMEEAEVERSENLLVTCPSCPQCKVGSPKVSFKPPNRYFWGCTSYPKCRGPTEWNSVQVPRAQRRECDEMYLATHKGPGEREPNEKKITRSPPQERPGDDDKLDGTVDSHHGVVTRRGSGVSKKRK